MALRYYIEPKTLRGEAWRLEIHDRDFSGSATEVTGGGDGFTLEYEGDVNDPFSPVMTSSLTFEFLVENAVHENFINFIATSREGRFHVVLKRGEGLPVDWVGVIISDQVIQRDKYYPYLTSLYAVDGIARMRDVEYSDDGDEYTGRETMLQHLYRCFEKIGLMNLSGVTMPSVRFRSNCNWYSEDMVTTTDPLAQAKIDNARFYEKKTGELTKFYSVYDVLEVICKVFGARLLFTRGAYTFIQVSEVDNATQKFRKFDEDGNLIGTDSGVNIDVNIDYTDEDEAKKLTGGNYTFLPAIQKVIVDYHHVTSSNRATGVTYNSVNGPLTETILPGNIVVDADDTTNIEFLINFSVRTKNLNPANVGYTTYPPHRYKFLVTLRVGGAYLKRNVVVSNLYDLQPTDATWFLGTNYIEVYSPVINSQLDGQEVPFQMKITTPYLITAYNNQPISINVELQHIAAPAIPAILVETITQYPPTFAWKTNDISVVVKEEGYGDNPSPEIVRYTALDSTQGNTTIYETETRVGDGPQPYSISRLTVGSGATSEWKVGGAGTGAKITQLLAKSVMSVRQSPVRVYQGTVISERFYPYFRAVDGTSAYWALRLSLSAFRDFWEGEFAKVANVFVSDTEPPYVPPPTAPPPFVPPPTFLLDPFGSKITGYTIVDAVALAEVNGEAIASFVNAPSPNELTILPVGFAFAKAGDKFKLINPASGENQILTIAEDYVVGSTTLKFVEDLENDYPHNSLLVNALRYSAVSPVGWAEQFTEVSGNYVTATAGDLPDPSIVTSAEIIRRVKVYRGGGGAIRSLYNVPGGFTIDYSNNRIYFDEALREENVLIEVI